MKWLLISAIVAPLLSPAGAWAQGSVTVWGLLNASVESQKSAGNNKAAAVLAGNGSRLGVRGREDLGGGLRAGFHIVSGLQLDNGSQEAPGAFWNRRAEVNLAGDFGMLRLGRLPSEAYFATASEVSLFNLDEGSTADLFYANLSLGPYRFHANNKIAYRSPALAGLTVEGALSLGEGQTERGQDLAINFEKGPLHLGLGHEKAGAVHQSALRAAWVEPAWTLAAYLQRDANAYANGTRSTWRFSGQYRWGAEELYASFGRAAGDYSTLPGSAARQWTVALSHNFSPRTSVYADINRIDDPLGLYTALQRSFAVGIATRF